MQPIIVVISPINRSRRKYENDDLKIFVAAYAQEMIRRGLRGALMYPPAVRSGPCSPKRSVAEFNKNLTPRSISPILGSQTHFLGVGKISS